MSDNDELAKAKEIIKQKRVSRIRDKNIELTNHFQVLGSNEKRYLVILPYYCTCMHFHINCVKTPNMVCKHILACRLVSDRVPEIEVDNWQDYIFDQD